ncbi:phosphoglycerate dehydrogenase-like enzyme [Cytobacillus eiseniae]|uniref:Phosphoglycerate dehydrogenase-like enzyme n=1 Tax=Cytobacillus eiseniae TaxID=762947 RepID=A0ABS4RAE8_9BACI|nr:D-2-hydroxyacid dehydrogenase [Cytobacillus eiseniae]MBP2239856.1 phosphoglycerate dehydrogenase-like enzyme [Cytobacillus eiseniae]
MQIKNILVAGEYKELFQNQLLTEDSQNFRFIPVDEITIEDLTWACAYVGFKPCPDFNLTNLKWVHSFNAGVNNYLELEGWEENDVLLTRTICSFGERISEYCLSYILKDLQFHTYFEAKQKEKKWAQKTPKMVKDQTFVIFGTGEIGQAVAKTFNQFGATVYGVSQSGKQKSYFKSVVKTDVANSLVECADWVISTLPLTTETEQLFNHELFSHFNGAAFINVGRGATVDETALIEGLNSGKIRYAVLDVLSTEPLAETSSLWRRNDLVITPHISAVTDLNEAISCFHDTLRKIETNEPLLNKVTIHKGY